MADSTPSPSNHSRPKKLLDQVRDAICLLPAHRGKLCPLGQTFFHDKRHLNDMGRLEIEAFLTHSRARRCLDPESGAWGVLFLYRNVLHCDDPALFESLNMARAEKPAHLPTVLTKEQVTRIIHFVPDEYQLMARLIYAADCV
jgi:hypothetical protein